MGWYATELLLEQADDPTGPSADPEPTEVAGPEPGWGRVVLGAPSGAPPRPRPAAPEPEEAAEAPPMSDGPNVAPPGSEPESPSPTELPPRYPADLELVVRSGQSLSKIVAESYGRSTPDLVRRLAAYNGMSDPDRMRAGQHLRVPVKEKLLATTP